MMKTMTFECETVTPMFLAGADGRTPELRPPSIKGSMRFWWRAMNGHLSIGELRGAESKIFGGTGENGRKSAITIRVPPQKLRSSKNKFPNHPVKVKSFNINILEYLAYGTFKYKKVQGNVFTRNYIKSDQKFLIIINVHSKLKGEIINSLQILSTFGGLGSRSRNGFGAFKILSINGNSNNFYFSLGKSEYTSKRPKYSAFSKNMRLWKTNESYNRWDEALAELGGTYRAARLNIDRTHHPDKRKYISAPTIIDNTQWSKTDRHAKPYFMTVHKQEDEFTGYVLYLPSEYAAGLQQENFNNDEETKNFASACDLLNDNMDNILREVIL